MEEGEQDQVNLKRNLKTRSEKGLIYDSGEFYRQQWKKRGKEGK